MTYSGATLAVDTGPFGDSYPNFDGTDDYADRSLLNYGDRDATIVAWIYSETHEDFQNIIGMGGDGDYDSMGYFCTDGNGYLRVFDGDSSTWHLSNTTTAIGTWYLAAITYDTSAGDGTFWLNASTDGTWTLGESDDDLQASDIGRFGGGVGRYWDGSLAHVMWFDRILTSSEFQELYDAANGTSTLTTATKSFSAPEQPDLVDLSYTLNGGNVEVEAIGSPGTTDEEVVTSGNLDGTQTSATLSWSNSHTDFRVRPNLKTSSITADTPTVSRIALQA